MIHGMGWEGKRFGLRKSVIFPIYKEGNISDVANYRGIFFVNSVGKILTSILNDRLSNCG